MTLQEAETQLQRILDEAYTQDSSIRHDPLYQELIGFLALVRRAVDDAADDANWEAFEKWQADRMLDHSRCPDDGDCLVDANTGHTTAF